MDFEKDAQINESELDMEWLNQPSIAYQYGKVAADCRKEVNLIDERIKVLRSDLNKAVVSDPMGTVGKEKPTIADIDAYTRDHPKHQKLKEELIEAQYELEMAEIAKIEMCSTRKVALENLVKLHALNYFAGPQAPHDLEQMRKAKERKTKFEEEQANFAVAAVRTRKDKQK